MRIENEKQRKKENRQRKKENVKLSPSRQMIIENNYVQIANHRNLYPLLLARGISLKA